MENNNNKFNNNRSNTPDANATGEKKFGNRPNRPRNNERKEDDGLLKKTVGINRVTKVVKGGRTMRFAALVVVGDGKGKVGLGIGKAAEVPAAIEKATQQAKRAMIDISLEGTTIPHQIIGKFSKAQVILMPAPTGTGVIAGGSVRNVLEVCGIKDIRAKSHGSSNPINNVRATMEGLKLLKTQEEIANKRNLDVDAIKA